MSETGILPQRSWVEIDATSDFSLQNIPFGVFSVDIPRDSSSIIISLPRCGSAIGPYAIDLAVLAREGIFDNLDEQFQDAREVFSSSTLNLFMAKPRRVWKAVRRALIGLLMEGGEDTRLSANETLQSLALVPLEKVIMHLPATIPNYTDFYSSREHATNVGIMFRGKDNALQPNWLHLPVGYHGRASSVYLSGTDIVRPSGQLQLDPNDPTMGSHHGPCKLLDFELEMSFFVGGGGGGGAPSCNPPGTSLTMSTVQDHIFGFTLMNDWSARDVQKWEYVPLGPFTSKNFATTISPWVVTLDALEPFRCPTSAVAQDKPEPLDYLKDPTYSSYDVKLEVKLMGDGMIKPETISRTNYANMYWNAKQQLVHHSVTGCNMQPGDLLGSGTISGTKSDSFGSMLELSWKGTREVRLGNTAHVRKFLRDYDVVIMEGWCEKEGYGRVGFGSCVGRILPVGSKLVRGPGNGTWVEEPKAA